MIHQLNAVLASVRAQEFERAARERCRTGRAFATPIVRERPRPVGPQNLDPFTW